MKKIITLRDLTPEQWNKNRDSLCKLDTLNNCDTCMFKEVNCSESFYKNSWIYHKDSYSDKFLDQEVEIEIRDILDEGEKDYLNFVIKPFKDRVVNIKKVENLEGKYYIRVNLLNDDNMLFPYLLNKNMYKNMKENYPYTLNDLGLTNKITLEEFWESTDRLAIHCDTEEKAVKLLKVFDKMGKKWRSGNSYIEMVCWGPYKQNICYDNDNGYSSSDYYKANDYRIYEFEDVMIEEEENE